MGLAGDRIGAEEDEHQAEAVKTAVDLGWVGLVVSAPVSFIEQGLMLAGVVVVVSD